MHHVICTLIFIATLATGCSGGSSVSSGSSLNVDIGESVITGTDNESLTTTTGNESVISGLDGEGIISEFDDEGIITGVDESSSAFWDCTFANPDTIQIGINTLTYWANGRGITGGGALFSWSLIGEESLEAIFDSGDRSFVYDELTFSEDRNAFTALETSTQNPGMEDEFSFLLDVSCDRIQ